ncbi:MAG: FAD-binding oxidoreductase [Moraxellaceae bacterium]|nr:MAG: FAD-binding oxidoreductase [Moraxellaceae bacterium]
MGSFGNHLSEFKLLRSNGDILNCSDNENSDYFSATIGGLGLTGIILSAKFQLMPLSNPDIIQETIRFENLKQFFKLASKSEQSNQYTVAWVDCLATGTHTGRGLFMRGNHSTAQQNLEPQPSKFTSLSSKPILRIPFTPPISLINRWTLKAFNQLYYSRNITKQSTRHVSAEQFFYPLDSIKHWNRIYGPKGFLQHQCVIPMKEAEPAITELLRTISRHRTGSFLAVLKTFGSKKSRGLLSFPRAGATLALDFPYQGEATQNLFAQLNQITVEAGGAIYPAKDATMNQHQFQQSFPRHEEFSQLIDPQFNSAFWERVMGTKESATKTAYQRATQ